jgi:hypothetical protein
MKSSSQIRGSCCPLNLTMPSLSLIPFGNGVERIRRLKHSALHSPSLAPPNVSASRSSSKRRASRHARPWSTLFWARPCRSCQLRGSTTYVRGTAAGTGAGCLTCSAGGAVLPAVASCPEPGVP